VLRKMRGLSGAEFVLMDRHGEIFASSAPRGAFAGLETPSQPSSRYSLTLGKAISLESGRFFHTALDLRRTRGENRSATLHILYPEESYREAWRDAVYPPMLVGAVAIVLVVGLGLVIASRVTRPLRRLQSQVEEIAEGDFQSLTVPPRNDEIADLSRSVNRMAAMLAKYEGEVRQNERLRTLGQLGGGIAHQMRNSVTGCRLAVELHTRLCRQNDETESIGVAMRQLELMEKYLQRFLRLDRGQAKPHAPVDMHLVVDSVVSLVGPAARHVGVELQWNASEKEPRWVQGDADALEQMLVNLLLNGIEAAARIEKDSDQQKTAFRRRVIVSLGSDGEHISLKVSDNGKGPVAEVREKLFEPFVTAKPDGTGLGLSMAREIVTAHGGKISWQRRDTTTCFVVELPAIGQPCNLALG